MASDQIEYRRFKGEQLLQTTSKLLTSLAGISHVLQLLRAIVDDTTD